MDFVSYEQVLQTSSKKPNFRTQFYLRMLSPTFQIEKNMTPSRRKNRNKKSTNIVDSVNSTIDSNTDKKNSSDATKAPSRRRRKNSKVSSISNVSAEEVTKTTQEIVQAKATNTDNVIEPSENKSSTTQSDAKQSSSQATSKNKMRRRRVILEESTETITQSTEENAEQQITEQSSEGSTSSTDQEQMDGETTELNTQPSEELSTETKTSEENLSENTSSESEDASTNKDQTPNTSESSTAHEEPSDLESNTGFVKGTIGNAVIRAGSKKQDSEEKKKISKDAPKKHVLGKAVIALPEGYDPNKPKQHILKAKEAKAAKDDRWTDSKTTKVKTEGDRGERVDRAKKGERLTSQKRTRRESRRIIEQRFEYKMDDLGSNSSRKKRRKKGGKKVSPKAKAIKRRVFIDTTITVGDLAHDMSMKASLLLKKLIELGQMATINDDLDIETATLLAEEFDYEVVNTTFQEEKFMINNEEEKEKGESRPPVVTIMGHVDHGKTTLLDSIRKANVAGGEAGGITQHLSAYQVSKNDQLITFIDTPGHAAFTAMRERGAQVTDIVVLVVAADDGVMPQTVEALNHAKAADVQIMVAINKCDKPGANPDKVRQELMGHELIPEEYGGETIMTEVSALNGQGIDDLLENILLLSEIGEYEAPTDRHAEGSVLEAKLEKGRGPVATILIKKGTLKVGDSLVLGKVWGRVRAMTDYRGKKIKVATPSMPIEIIGIQDVPTAGDDFIVVKSDKDARTLVEHRLEEEKQRNAEGPRSYSLEDLIKMQQEGETLKLNLIIKSDVGGTLEAMKASLDKIEIEGTDVRVIHSAVGAISESDIVLASINECIVIGFNVRPDAKARKAVSNRKVDVRTYKVIYEALNDIEKALKGMLSPDTKEMVQGHAEIRQVFSVPKVGSVGGCYVTDGKISRSHSIRLLRQGNIIWEGKLASLRRFKDDVKEVTHGYECGMNLEAFNDIKEGDEIEAYTMEEVPV
jgi:translation initiation factor IF-2